MKKPLLKHSLVKQDIDEFKQASTNEKVADSTFPHDEQLEHNEAEDKGQDDDESGRAYLS